MKNNKILGLGLLLALGVPFTSFASIDKNLKYGQKDAEVKELQEFFIQKGLLNTTPSNYFGQLTFKAVKAYQASINLPTTGFVGALTREKINTEISKGAISVSVNNLKTNQNTDNKTLIAQAEEQIKLLEEDKLNFELLRKTTTDHEVKAKEHASKIMDDWILFTESSIPTFPSQYQQYLTLTKESIVSDKSYVLKTISAYYSVMDLYFINSLNNKSKIETIGLQQKGFSDCINNWKTNVNHQSCLVALKVIPSLREGYVDDFKNITSKLVTVDNDVLEIISNHAKTAEKDVSDDLERIGRLVNITATTQANFDQIESQLKQSYSQPYLRASDRIVAKLSVAKFWNSSTYK